MSKRICLIRQNYFPAEAHVRKNVDALVDAGYEVDVVCLREPGAPARESYRGGTISRLPLTHSRGGILRYLFEYLAFFIMATLLMAMRSARAPYDVVETYNMPDFLVFAALPQKLRGARIIFYMFELTPEHATDQFGVTRDHWLTGLLRWVERRSVRFAHQVIVVSEYQREIVLARSEPRAAPTVVLNVPDDDLFRPSDAPAENGAFRVLTHGSILRRYGIQTLIRAVPYIETQVPTLEVYVLGEGEYRESLQQLAGQLGVGERVHFLDYVPIEHVPGMIAEADVGVVATPLPWLLPNKLFEYVAMERAVVASASPSYAPLFSPDALAYFWPDDERDLARRIIEIYDDPERARAMAETAREQFERYRWQSMKHEYVASHEAPHRPSLPERDHDSISWSER